MSIGWFLSLEDAQEKFDKFREDYNRFRPHSSLGNLSPNQYLNQTFNSSGFPVLTGPL